MPAKQHQHTTTRLVINNIHIGLDGSVDTAIAQATSRLKRAGVPVSGLTFRLHRRSIDARHRDRILQVCSVLVESRGEVDLLRLPSRVLSVMDANPYATEDLVIENRGLTPMPARPLVVGMGPAGLFCALLLAENGYRPILIDRGEPIADRVRAVERFHTFGVLDTESNIQFGAGGAGTFSDGKLLTRINDARCAWVLRRLHEFGAPDEILYQAKPHIGTDVLRNVVDSLLTRIEELGGELHYRTRLEDITELGDGTLSVRTNQGDIRASVAVLAIGHSARDTYRMLIEENYSIVAKPISVGVRIEHLQADIDRAMYGDAVDTAIFGHAEYALSDTKSARGVYTFCMCPGGGVVAAASEQERLVVNGMSHHARDGANANSAIAVSVHPEDYEPCEGNLALGAIAYQRSIEHAAFVAGGGNYAAPIQTVGDFLRGEVHHAPTTVQPSYRGGMHYQVTDLAHVFPSYVTEHLRYGITSFDRRIRGFAADTAVLTGAETRTSAPVRILRDDDLCAIGHNLIYPCGEGAGYAGGITSAAVDGIRVALAMIARFAPYDF
jgi:uncharacterized FAD-dependent dehydrogenase